MARPAIVQSVFEFAMREINALEGRIVTAEDDADAMLWEQAASVVEQLEKGQTQRGLAEQWINVRTGEPYSLRHVQVVRQVVLDYLDSQPRPRFRDAYNKITHAEPKAHVSHNSGNNEWYTPAELVEAARGVLGDIDLDPASSDAANAVVKAAQIFTVQEDGLLQSWHGRVWMNPPYAQPAVEHFATKLADSYQAGDVTAATVLVNNATETAWCQTLSAAASAVCLLNGRVRFWSPDRDELATPLQGQIVLYLGDDTSRFADAFRAFGQVLVKP